MKKNNTNPQLLEIGALTYQWLSALKQKVNKEFIKSEIADHPDYPELSCVVDLLDEGGLEYCTRRAGIDEANEFHYPCIVHLSLPTGADGLFQVNNVAELEAVQAYWNGIVLYAMPGSKWQHPVNKEMTDVNRLNLYSFLVFSFLLFFVTIIGSVYSNSNNFIKTAFLFSGAAGILIGLLTISEELHLVSEFVQKICGINSNRSGCANVLSSKYAKGKKGVSIAELIVVYFIGQWLIFFSAAWIPVAAIISHTVITISLGGFLVAAWSIYTQKTIIRHWCILCLGLAGILVFQSIIACMQKPFITGTGMAGFIAVLLGVFIVIHPVKKLLEKLRRLDVKQRELYRWKKDIRLFMQQLENEEWIDCSSFEEELELANPNGIIQFTIACSPYCVLCATTYQQIDRLIDNYGSDISVKVRFAINAADHNNEQTVAANLIINTSMESKITRKAVHDWFAMMDAKTFLERWPLKNDESNFELLKKHELWAEAAKIEYTPAVFINGKRLPKRYAPEDLMFIIPELYIQLTEN